MSSKRFKNLPTKTLDLSAELVEKLIPEVKKNCTTKFDESVDLNFQIEMKFPLYSFFFVLYSS